LPMVWHLLNTSQTKMSFEESTNKAVVFILQTDTKRVEYEKARSFRGGNFLFDVPTTLTINIGGIEEWPY
jgi:hypothetical protein